MAEPTLPTDLRLDIVTPDRLVAHDAVTGVTIPGKNGYLGILPGHAPLLTELVPGELEYTSGGAPHVMAVTWGFVEVLPDRVTILASDALRPDEIDAARAGQQLDRGMKMWNEAGDSEEAYTKALHVISEAEAKLASAGEKR